MSRWLRRTVGSAGVAAAFLLLGAGAAPAHVSAPADRGIGQEPQVPETLRASIDGPNEIGDDFVDQSPEAGLLPVAEDVSIRAGALGRQSPG